MAIPEKQLDTWSAQGSVQQSKTTYQTIRNALEAAGSAYADKDFDVFLQGSYGNDTNVYAESDVDIVIKLKSVFQYDLSDLSDAETSAFKSYYVDATYGLSDFRRDVIAQLKSAFGSDVEPGSKAIKVKANGGRRNADVLPCLTFKRYMRFAGRDQEQYAEGVVFYDKHGNKIVNYPKIHSANLTTKHQATGGWLKPSVRILKNMRNRMISDGVIKKGLAPSYFLEGMLYNVPNEKFGKSYEDTIVSCINWVLSANRDALVCANEQHYLVRDSLITWPPADFDKFMSEVVKYWQQWGQR